MLFRKIEKLIDEHLRSDSKKILLIDGARQIGKTYIIRNICDNAEKKGSHVLILAHRRILLNQHGKLIKNALKSSIIDAKNFNKLLKTLKVGSLKDLIILSIDDNGKVYYQTKKNEYQIYNIKE